MTFDNECFCSIKGDEELHILPCGHRIHYNCAIQMEYDKCPWCRQSCNIFYDIFITKRNDLFLARIIKMKHLLSRRDDEYFILDYQQPQESYVYNPQSADSPPPPAQQPTHPGYNGPITRSRRHMLYYT